VIALPLVALLLAAPAARPAPLPPRSLKWESSLAAALEKAKASGKPVMIDFWAEWCGYCHLLDRTTYRDPSVIRRSAAFVSVKVNSEGSPDEVRIASRYLVNSLPTILFLSPGGRPFLRLSGYLPANRFLMALAEMTRRSAFVLDQEAILAREPNDPAALRTLGLHAFTQITLMAERDPDQRMSKQMFEDAQDLLSRACRVDQGQAPAERKRVRSALGILHGYEGKFAEAEALLKEALALPADAENDARAYSGLGEIYMMQKKKDLAREAFRQVVEHYPQSDDAQLAKRYLQTLGPPP
jgi:thiol-disulfide isomerase/thioredoxin